MIEPSIETGIWTAAFARAASFAATAPLAGSGAVPRAVRAVLAISLTPAIARHLLNDAMRDPASAGWLDNALIGAAFGVAASAAAAAVGSAGAIVDGALTSKIVGGDTSSSGSGGPFSHLFALAFASAFIGTGALTHMCERFVAASSGASLVPSALGAIALARSCVSAALALAAPAIVAQLVGTIVAGMTARAAPRINGLMLLSPIASALVLLSMLAAVEPTAAHIIEAARDAGSVKAL